MRSLLLLFLFPCLPWVFGAVSAKPALEFDRNLIDLSRFKPDETNQRMASPKGEILRVSSDPMSLAKAKKVLKDRLVQLKILYMPHGAPYPGMLTQDQSCAESAILPARIVENQSAVYWYSEMPATQGLIYGTCGTMAEPYWSEQLLIYCKAQKMFYDVRYFQLRKGKARNPLGKPIAKCEKMKAHAK